MERSAEVKGLPKNAIRYLIPEARRTELDRAGFGEVILKGVLGLSGADVLCLQDYPAVGWHDVTFRTEEAMRAVFEKKTSDVRISGIRRVAWNSFNEVVVQVFNPHVLEMDVRVFLSRYCSAIAPGVKVMDANGFWTGKWRYSVQFRVSKEGRQLRPPHLFALGTDRGRVFLPDLPTVCWGCGEEGHLRRECVVQRCVRCGVEGHVVKDCGERRECSLCGAKDHLFLRCPKRQSYAGAVVGLSGGGGVSVSQAGAPVVTGALEQRSTGLAAAGASGVTGAAVSAGGAGAGPHGGCLVATANARPHGRQDGRQEVGGSAGSKGRPGVAMERVGTLNWAEATASQEEEMAELALVSGKRPLEGGGPEGAPVRRQRPGEGVADGDRSLPLVAESGTAGEMAELESDELADSEESVTEGRTAGRGSRPAPAQLTGWDVESLKRTMGMD